MTAEHAEKVRSDVALLLVRFVVGWVFVFHGAQKLFGAFGGPGIEGTAEMMGGIGIPLPTLSAVLAGGTEFLGGAALIVGFGVRWAAIPLVVTMLVAATQVHRGFDIQKNGYEYTLVLAAVAAGLGLTGPGRISLRALVGSFRKVDRRPKLDTAVANIRQ